MSATPADDEAASAPSAARALDRLAMPLVLTNVGNMAMGVVDTAIVGRMSEASMAAAALGNAIFFVPTIFGMGLLLGLDPLISQAIGAGDGALARRTLWQGVWIALVVSAPLAIVIVGAAELLPLVPVPTEAIAPTREYLYARTPGLPAFLVLTAVRGYLTARGRTRSLVVAMLAANALNLPADIALGFGVPALGLPALGVAGTGIASSVSSFAQLGVALWPLGSLGVHAAPRARVSRAWDAALVARSLRVGVPLGLQFVLEAGSFSVVTFLAAAFGAVPLAAHNVALMLVSLTFQVALGLGAATSTLVGRAIGRDDTPAARRAGLTGIAIGLVAMSAGACAFMLFPHAIGALMTDDAAVIEAAAPFLFVAACFQLSDGTQTIAQGALRGAGDTLVPLAVNLVGHYVIGLSVGVTLAFSRGHDATGLWWGLSLGLTAVAALMTARFLALSSRPMART